MKYMLDDCEEGLDDEDVCHHGVPFSEDCDDCDDEQYDAECADFDDRIRHGSC